MKNVSLQRILPLGLILGLGSSLCFLSGCEQKQPIAEVSPNDSLLREFSQSPPVIRNISLKRLKAPDKDGNTVLLTARFAETETRLKGINSIPLSLDEKREVKLNDRGINGDEKATDGMFSISLKVSDDELTTLLNHNNEVLAKQKNIVTTFNGRLATVQRARQFSIDSVRLGRIIPFEVFVLTSVTSATLPDIREKSLMITDLSVVEDIGRTYDPCRSPKGNANGAWSFKTLITNMSGTLSAEEFLIDWVDNFLFSHKTLPSSTDGSGNRARAKERFVKAWMRNSGVTVPGALGVPAGWQMTALKAEEFPVRLLAIVNRLDLRGNQGYGGRFDNAGEGRFVFTFVDSAPGCGSGANGPGTMTFILEYGVPINGCQALAAYGEKWWKLQLDSFGPAFNTDLEAITNVFTAKDANPSRPNGSALNHLRTNDFLAPATIFPGDPWDIRDFEIDGSTKRLQIIHPSREPLERSNGFFPTVDAAKLSSIVAFANSLPFTPTNLNPSYTIPDDVKGIHGPMRVAPAVRYHWKGNSTSTIAPFKRREFSFNTCTGCHKGETNSPFTHIRQRVAGTAAELSGFMTGLGADDNSAAADDDTDPMGDFWVNDPGPTPERQRGFNDARFRARSLEDLIRNPSCVRRAGFPNDLMAVERILRFRPLNMVH